MRIQELYRRCLVSLIVALPVACSASDRIAEPPLSECGSGPVSVCPETLNAHELAKVSLPEKHPTNLAIRRPDGVWVYVRDPSQSVDHLPSLKGSSVIEFRADGLVGTIWVNGEPEVIPVFAAAGEYLFYFSDNLETEPENSFTLQVLVTYRGGEVDMR